MAMKPSPPESVARQETISVVYVDDYGELCELTAEGLEDASDRLEVETTTDPRAVLDSLDEFDCVVADYAMPEMDGLELLRRVRVITDELPFILYTGKGDEDVASEAISLGVTDYLAKTGGPERFVRLAHRIENVVEAQRASADARNAREQARTAIERQRSRLRALLEYSPAITGVLDESGRIEFLSPAVEDITGYPPRELRGEVAFEYVHRADRERAERAFGRVVDAPGTTLSVELRFRMRDGGWRHLQVRGTNHLENPAVEGVILNAQDVTDRKRTQGRLRRERDLTRRVFDVAPSPLLLLDRDGEIRRVNDRATEVFGVDRSTLLGHAPTESSVAFRAGTGEDIDGGDHLWEVVSHARRTVHDAQCEVSLPSGEYRLDVSAAPLPEADAGFVVVAVEDAEPVADGGDNNT